MTRRIVFAGGVQAKALAKAYRLDVAEGRDEDVFFIGADSMAREAAHRVVAAADVVVTDVGEHGEAVPDGLVPPRAVLVGVPVVRADFLWPFAAGPHPSNRATEAVPDGPYPADFGDSHLDGLLAQGIDPDEAVRQYVATDVAALADLDGLLAATLQLLATLDARTGFEVAGLVEREFRGGSLFASRHRMGLALFRHVAAQVFTRIGADPASARALGETHFPPGEMPIHPSVLRHFGMTAPAADHRYPVLDEGLFTFEEYCQRYVRCTWNARLHEAIALADVSPSDAVPLLRRALEDSPGSRAGQAALHQAERSVADAAQPPQPVLAAPEPHDTPVDAQTHTLAVSPAQAEPIQQHAPVVGNTLTPANATWPTMDDAQPMLSANVWAAPTRAIPPTASQLAPEQQVYVELPLSYNGHEVPAEEPAPTVPDRYTPLPPAQELIEVLPRMLPSSRGLGADLGPFAGMAESMPPPPLRPVLPPEIQAEPARRGLLAKLFGGGR